MNYEDFHIGCLYGKFPPIYRKTPSPGFDYFQYAMNDGLFYANHAIDSLIYVCSDQGEPLFSFGFDSPMADRSYSVSKEHFDESTFEKDAKHVSFNTGLDYIPETEQIIRTICFDPKEPKTCIQIYDGKAFDLIYETHVDGIYKYLTYQEGKYIGTSLYQDEKSSIYYLTIK